MMKKWVASLSLFIIAAGMASAQYYFDYPRYHKFEFSFIIGTNLPLIKGTTIYEDEWTDPPLTDVLERTQIDMKPRLGPLLGGSCCFFFTPRFGVQLAADYLTANIPNAADVFFQWIWSDGRYFQENVVWSGSGRLTSLPLSLNLVYQSDIGRNGWFLSAGLTHFSNTFQAESSFGLGISTLTEDNSLLLVDALRIGLKIAKTSWSTVGFNFGGGVNFKISNNFGFKAEARYFWCPQKEFSWEFIKGVYDGVFFSQYYEELRNQKFPYYENESDLAGISKKMTRLRPLNSSFFRFAVGFVLFLGSTEY